MYLRQTVNSHPVATTLVIVAAVVVAFFFVFRGGSSASPSIAGQTYISSDDGATWSPGTLGDLAKPNASLRAHVFKCAKDGKQFVGYLERFRAGMFPPGATPPAAMLAFPSPSFVEVKRRGDKTWMPGAAPAADAIRKVQCPAGDGGEVTELQP